MNEVISAFAQLLTTIYKKLGERGIRKPIMNSTDVVLHANNNLEQDSQLSQDDGTVTTLENWEERRALLDQQTFLEEQNRIHAQIECEDQEALVLEREKTLLEMQALHEQKRQHNKQLQAALQKRSVSHEHVENATPNHVKQQSANTSHGSQHTGVFTIVP